MEVVGQKFAIRAKGSRHSRKYEEVLRKNHEIIDRDESQKKFAMDHYQAWSTRTPSLRGDPLSRITQNNVSLADIHKDVDECSTTAKQVSELPSENIKKKKKESPKDKNSPFRDLLIHWNQKSSTSLASGTAGTEPEEKPPEPVITFAPRRNRTTSITDQLRKEKAKQLQQLEDKARTAEQQVKNLKRTIHLKILDDEKHVHNLQNIRDNLKALQRRSITREGGEAILEQALYVLDMTLTEMKARASPQPLPIPSPSPKIQTQLDFKTRKGSKIGKPSDALVQQHLRRSGSLHFFKEKDSRLAKSQPLKYAERTHRRSYSDPLKHSWDYKTEPFKTKPPKTIECESPEEEPKEKEPVYVDPYKPRQGSRLVLSVVARDEPVGISPITTSPLGVSLDRVTPRRSAPPAAPKTVPLLLLNLKEPTTSNLDKLVSDYEEGFTGGLVTHGSTASLVHDSPIVAATLAESGLGSARKRELVFNLSDNRRVLVAGSVSAIVDWLLEKNTDTSKLKVFLNTYRSFIKPKDLFTMVIQHFTGETDPRPMKRALFFIKEWMTYHCKDFKDNEVAPLLNIFLSETMPALGWVDFSTELQSLLKMAEEVSLTNRTVVSTPKKKHLSRLEYPSSGRIELLSISAIDAAQQLTLIEHQMFQEINPPDCIKRSDGGSLVSSAIEAMIGRFNYVSEWVSTEVVMTPNIKQRVAVLKRFITIANKCLELNNFNTLLEITAGLNNADVQRLKSTWRLLPSKYLMAFEELEAVMAPKRNFKTYRDALKMASTPALPYFGIYLRDVTFIDEGNSDYVEDDLVNFVKLEMISNIVQEIESYQKSPFEIEPLPVLQNYFKNLLILPETTRYKYSLLCEPRTEEVRW
eukprot:TRINITY_DN826_c0_g8_i3.p1 TRINITY_DN826_c0_g8~~TRINITY_DN826_c0_g8_i3.p1  ORF type:complete len:865 (+),score=193.10 TRINITY_DN826_c0_g8_i3:912-3506(+)